MRRLVTAAIPCLALVAEPLAAQQTGSLIRPAPAEVSDHRLNAADSARQTMYNFTACVLKKRPATVMRFLGLFPGTTEADALARQLTLFSECLVGGAGSSLRFNEPIFRGAAFELLYRQRFGRTAPGDLSAIASPDYGRGANLQDTEQLQAVAFRRFGDCVVRANPATAHALAFSRPGSADEKSAFDGLLANLSACLPGGKVFRFTKLDLRAAIGETLYRIRSGDGPEVTTAGARDVEH